MMCLVIKRFINQAFHLPQTLLFTTVINKQGNKNKIKLMLKASFFVFIKAPAPLEVLYLEFIFICEQQKNVRLHFLLWKMKDFRFIPSNMHVCKDLFHISNFCYFFSANPVLKKRYFILKFQLKFFY